MRHVLSVAPEVYVHMAERAVIVAAPRTVLGKKVKQLRRQGRLPANVYGKGIPSTALDLDSP